MTLQIETRRYTIPEYLEFEAGSADQHEYYNGEVVAMAGGTPQHSLIIANSIREIGQKLKGKPCRVYDSNLRVRVPGSALYVYPDASVICGPAQHDPDDKRKLTVTNPTLIVEVLSPSTEHLDYGLKLRQYVRCATLMEYLLIASDEPDVQTLFRQNDGTWQLSPVREMKSSIQLRSLGIELPLAEIYAGVDFSSPSDGAAAQ